MAASTMNVREGGGDGPGAGDDAVDPTGSGRWGGFAVFLPLGLILFTFVVLAGPHLTAEVWLDEGLTLKEFVSRGPGYFLTHYHIPNNHILFNLMLWPLYELGGNWDAPVILLRAMPFAWALAGVLFIYIGMQTWASRSAAVLAAAFLGLSHSYIIYSGLLRGYPVSAALVCLGLFFLMGMNERNGVRAMGGFAIAAIVAVGVVPTNLLPFSCMGVYFYLTRRRIKQSWTLPFIPLLGFVWYVPVRQAFMYNLGYGYGKASRLEVLKSLGLAAFADIWWAWPAVLLGLLALIFRWRGRGEDTGPEKTWLFHLVVYGALFSFILLSRKAPYPRTFFAMLPLVFVSLALLADRGLALFGSGRRWRASPGALMGLAVLVCAVAMGREAVYPHLYRARYGDSLKQGLYHQWFSVDYRPSWVMEFINEVGEGSRPVLCVAPTDFGLWYYRLKVGCEGGNLMPVGGKPRPKFGPPGPWAQKGRLLVFARTPGELRSIMVWLEISDPGRLHALGRVGHMRVYRVLPSPEKSAVRPDPEPLGPRGDKKRPIRAGGG